MNTIRLPNVRPAAEHLRRATQTAPEPLGINTRCTYGARSSPLVQPPAGTNYTIGSLDSRIPAAGPVFFRSARNLT